MPKEVTLPIGYADAIVIAYAMHITYHIALQLLLLLRRYMHCIMSCHYGMLEGGYTAKIYAESSPRRTSPRRAGRIN